MRFWLILSLLAGQFVMINPISKAEPAISLAESLMPGGIMIGNAPVGSVVRIDGRAVRVSDDGDFVFGVGRNAEGSVQVVIDCPDGNQVSREIRISGR
ncbi:MAG: hypothetical protein ACR2QH_06810, partial [Geminicoccaceae bacterium]